MVTNIIKNTYMKLKEFLLKILTKSTIVRKNIKNSEITVDVKNTDNVVLENIKDSKITIKTQ